MWGLIILYVLLIPCVALYLREKHRPHSDVPRIVALKAACTTMIVLAAVIGAAGAPAQARLYVILVAAGLVFGLVGDVVICQEAPGGFLSGMLYFALGHLCYIAAFLGVTKHVVWAVPVFIVIYLALVFAVRGQRAKLEGLYVPVLIYGAIIAAMVSLSATMPFSEKRGWVLLLGAALFAVSDGILAYGLVKKRGSARMGMLASGASNPVDSFGLYCYFIGQSLFAVSIYCLR